jgi:hypothetical protein
MKSAVLLIFLLIIPFGLAANFEYTILDKKVLTKINLQESEFEFLELPSDINLLDFIEKDGSIIKFTTDSLIEKSGDNYFFIVKNKLHLNSTIKVYLPRGAVLEKMD